MQEDAFEIEVVIAHDRPVNGILWPVIEAELLDPGDVADANPCWQGQSRRVDHVAMRHLVSGPDPHAVVQSLQLPTLQLT